MTSRNPFRLIALVLVGIVLLAACNDGGSGGVGSSAASIDGASITDAQVGRNVKIFTFLSGLNGQPCGAKVAGETDQAACARFALGSLIQEHFVDAYAAENDVSVPQSDVEGTITQLEQSLGGAKAVDDQLTTAGITRTDLLDLARRLLLFQAVQTEVAGESADDAALRTLYQDNLLQFTTIDTEHILVKTQKEAQDVYDQVTAPGATEKEFLALAKKVSVDPSAQQNSGALGPTSAAGLDQAYAATAVALKPGEISQPVQSQFGWHVIRLVSSQVASFADAKPSLLQQQGTQAFDTWLTDRVKSVEIDVNPKYGRFDPATQSVEAITSTATGSPSPDAAGSPAAPAS